MDDEREDPIDRSVAVLITTALDHGIESMDRETIRTAAEMAEAVVAQTERHASIESTRLFSLRYDDMAEAEAAAALEAIRKNRHGRELVEALITETSVDALLDRMMELPEQKPAVAPSYAQAADGAGTTHRRNGTAADRRANQGGAPAQPGARPPARTDDPSGHPNRDEASEGRVAAMIVGNAQAGLAHGQWPLVADAAKATATLVRMVVSPGSPEDLEEALARMTQPQAARELAALVEQPLGEVLVATLAGSTSAEAVPDLVYEKAVAKGLVDGKRGPLRHGRPSNGATQGADQPRTRTAPAPIPPIAPWLATAALSGALFALVVRGAFGQKQ